MFMKISDIMIFYIFLLHSLEWNPIYVKKIVDFDLHAYGDLD